MVWQTTQPSLLLRVRDPADQSAWAEFDRRYGELIIRYCHRCGLQHSDAEDVRQIVLISLASAMRSFEYEPRRGRFRSYLGRVVRNAVTRHARCPRGRPIALDIDGSVVAAADESDERWEREWAAHHLRMAMERLRRTCAPARLEAFDRLLSGATVTQVAEEHAMSVDAVHKLKQRMRDRLKELVAEQIDEEDGVDADRG